MNQKNRMIPIFREVQHFRQFWIWALVLAITGLIWYAAIIQLVMQNPFGDRPMPDIMLVVFWLVFGIGLPALIFLSNLVTEVREDGIYIRFVPFHRSFIIIAFGELKAYETRVYRPIMEYGGWGIRFGSKGRAYNVSGIRGVQLELANGRQLLIGSQRPEELRQSIETGAGKSQTARPREPF